MVSHIHIFFKFFLEKKGVRAGNLKSVGRIITAAALPQFSIIDILSTEDSYFCMLLPES